MYLILALLVVISLITFTAHIYRVTTKLLYHFPQINTQLFLGLAMKLMQDKITPERKITILPEYPLTIQPD